MVALERGAAMKKILSILVSFVLLFTVAFAAEPEASVSATFDLTQNGIQQIVTEDAEGNPVVVIVEKCSPSTRSESVGYGNSTWHIWYKSPLLLLLNSGWTYMLTRMVLPQLQTFMMDNILL